MLHPINVTTGKHLMYATPKKNKRICNILIFQNILQLLHSFTYTLTQHKHLRHKLPENNEMLNPVFCRFVQL